MKSWLRKKALETNPGYTFYLKRHGWGVSNNRLPEFSVHNSALKTHKEWQKACCEANELTLPSHQTPQKNRDSLISLLEIMNLKSKNIKILDAGATLESVILPWLYIYGFRNLLPSIVQSKRSSRWDRLHTPMVI